MSFYGGMCAKTRIDGFHNAEIPHLPPTKSQAPCAEEKRLSPPDVDSDQLPAFSTRGANPVLACPHGGGTEASERRLGDGC